MFSRRDALLLADQQLGVTANRRLAEEAENLDVGRRPDHDTDKDVTRVRKPL
jgi:hypothetical protein